MFHGTWLGHGTWLAHGTWLDHGTWLGHGTLIVPWYMAGSQIVISFKSHSTACTTHVSRSVNKV